MNVTIRYESIKLNCYMFDYFNLGYFYGYLHNYGFFSIYFDDLYVLMTFLIHLFEVVITHYWTQRKQRVWFREKDLPCKRAKREMGNAQNGNSL